MTRVINPFLLRHDTFRTWFAIDSDGTVRRRLVAPDVVDFVPIDYGRLDDAEAIRGHVQKTTPGPFQWDCFTFGAIEHGESTTVYLAVDRFLAPQQFRTLASHHTGSCGDDRDRSAR
ncbi:hypothetical protein [Nocardia sp. NPDC049526]|uniref:hypothetical protein n=1 Tax=Nocardia sp. NPDC049526 TaxID=3364316 RepID=UPI0037AFCA46